MPYFPIIGFTPDAETTIPGTLRDTLGLLPTKRGLEGLPTGEDADTSSAISESVTAAITIYKSDSAARTFAGTSKALYEAAGASWVDRSKGGGYDGSATIRWRFAQFGDTTYAAQKSDTIQKSTTAAFSDETNAPKASIIAVFGNFNLGSFLFAFDTNDGLGDQPDRWRCAAIGDPTDWTAAIATQSATGRLTSVPGKITAAWPIGNDGIVFKLRGCYLARYVGPPVIWSFTVISDKVGTPVHEAVVSDGDVLYWVALDDFYRFDGAQIAAIPNELKAWFFNDTLDQAFTDRIIGALDPVQGRVVWLFPSTTSNGALDKYIAYNYRSRIPRWTAGDIDASILLSFYSGGLAYDNVGGTFATYADTPTTSYDSAFLLPNATQLAIISTGGQLKTLTGAPAGSRATLWDMGAPSLTQQGQGSENEIVFLDKIRPRFVDDPAHAVIIPSSQDDLGGAWVSDDVSGTVALSFGHFDVLRSSRWHSERMEMSGSVELVGIHVAWSPDGET